MLWRSEREDDGLNGWEHPCLQERVRTYSFRSVDLAVSWAIAPDKALHVCSIAASSGGTFARATQAASSRDRTPELVVQSTKQVGILCGAWGMGSKASSRPQVRYSAGRCTADCLTPRPLSTSKLIWMARSPAGVRR